MNLNDAFPSKYLKASDLPEDGAIIFTIEKISLEEVGKDKETKPVIYFEEEAKGLVCNKTNGRAIARVAGSEEFDDWIGRKISLYRVEIDFQGEVVDAIRVKPPKPPPATGRAKPKSVPITQPTAASEDDEIPF